MLERDLNELRRELAQKGYFEKDTFFGVQELCFTLFLQALALFVTPSSLWVGGVCMGLFYVRAGWFSHDALHGQLFTGNCPGARWFVGWYQGLNSIWWTLKHNRHHVSPNSYVYKNNKMTIVDADIDTLPLLCWDLNFVDLKNVSTIQKKLIQYQKWTFWLILPFLRILWTFNSFESDLKQGRIKNFLLLCGYYIIVFAGLMLAGMSALQVFMFFLFANIVGGVLIGLVVVAHHFGFDPYEKKDLPKSFYILNSTRNIDDNALVRFLMGGMQWHIEHHLFSSISRRHLPLVAGEVKRICKENDIPYFSVSWFQALVKTHRHLQRVSLEFENVLGAGNGVLKGHAAQSK